MSDMKAFRGSCHCQAVRFEVTTALEGVMACNCSHCSRKNFRLAFVAEDQFKLLSGGERLTTYKFNKKVIDHEFCSTCGVQAFARGVAPDGKKTVAVNVCCLEDVDIGALPVKHVDGRSH